METEKDTILALILQQAMDLFKVAKTNTIEENTILINLYMSTVIESPLLDAIEKERYQNMMMLWCRQTDNIPCWIQGSKAFFDDLLMLSNPDK